MKYSIPDLHSLNARTAAGDAQNCGPGSAATEWAIGCTNGQGASGGGPGCVTGTGDGWGCYDGTAALYGTSAYCHAGTVPDSSCGNGPSPA